MGKEKHRIITALLLCGCAAAGIYTLRDQLRMILRQTEWARPGEITRPAPAPAEPAPAPVRTEEPVPAPIAAVEAEAAAAPAERSMPAPAGESTETVWWTKGGKSYHRSRECRTLNRSSDASICSGTVAEAIAAGKSDPCDLCAL